MVKIYCDFCGKDLTEYSDTRVYCCNSGIKVKDILVGDYGTDITEFDTISSDECQFPPFVACFECAKMIASFLRNMTKK